MLLSSKLLTVGKFSNWALGLEQGRGGMALASLADHEHPCPAQGGTTP